MLEGSHARLGLPSSPTTHRFRQVRCRSPTRSPRSAAHSSSSATRWWRAANDTLGINLARILTDSTPRGARFATTASIDEGAARAGAWGYDTDGVRDTLSRYDLAIRDDSPLEPPRGHTGYAPAGDDEIEAGYLTHVPRPPVGSAETRTGCRTSAQPWPGFRGTAWRTEVRDWSSARYRRGLPRRSRRSGRGVRTCLG